MKLRSTALSFLLISIMLLSITSCWTSRPDNPTKPAVTPNASQRPAQPGGGGNGQQSPSQHGPKQGALRLLGAEPVTMDPAMAQDVSSWGYLLQIFSGLVALDNKMEVVPEIASDWKVDDTGTVYTFNLRKEVRFHDGEAVTAADFKYSLERAADPKIHSPVAELYLGDIVGVGDKLAGKASEVSGVRVISDNTLQIKIDAPKPYFLSKMTYPTAYVVDSRNVQRGGKWWERPNGTGPFKLESWTDKEELLLVANDQYYGSKPKLYEVSYFLGAGSPMPMYERNELDVIQVGSADIDRVTDQNSPLNKQLVIAPQLGLWYVGLNTRAKPFDDPKVRQAFAMATDKPRIVDVLMHKIGVKADGILPPGMPGFGKELKALAFDTIQAKALLGQSTYGSADNLPPITLGSGGSGMGQTLADMYQRNLGVKINVEQVDQGFYDDIAASKYQMFYLGWLADYPDPQDFLDILFHGGSPGNSSGYANPTVDRLLEQARVERNETKRWTIYQQAEQAIVSEAPIIPVLHDVDYVLVKPQVKGLTWTPMGLLSLKDVTVEPQARP